jgi:uncharacterized SAM-binding protein YcdF (DUF218 family)
MFFFLSKILVFLISPLVWIFVLLLFSLFSKKPNRKRNLLIFAVLLLFLFSNKFLFNEVIGTWELKPEKISSAEKFDYVIVLGGFSKYDTVYNRVQLTNAGDRIWQAYKLYKEKKAAKIFISGGAGSILHQEITEADKVKNVLLKMQVPENDIIIEALSKNTHENAQNTMEWIKKHDSGAKCLLVTSSSHMRRAWGCFKKYDPNIKYYVSDIKHVYRVYDPDVLLKPDADVLNNWDSLIKEWVGYGTYKIMGYL